MNLYKDTMMRKTDIMTGFKHKTFAVITAFVTSILVSLPAISDSDVVYPKSAFNRFVDVFKTFVDVADQSINSAFHDAIYNAYILSKDKKELNQIIAGLEQVERIENRMTSNPTGMKSGPTGHPPHPVLERRKARLFEDFLNHKVTASSLKDLRKKYPNKITAKTEIKIATIKGKDITASSAINTAGGILTIVQGGLIINRQISDIDQTGSISIQTSADANEFIVSTASGMVFPLSAVPDIANFFLPGNMQLPSFGMTKEKGLRTLEALGAEILDVKTAYYHDVVEHYRSSVKAENDIKNLTDKKRQETASFMDFKKIEYMKEMTKLRNLSMFADAIWFVDFDEASEDAQYWLHNIDSYDPWEDLKEDYNKRRKELIEQQIDAAWEKALGEQGISAKIAEDLELRAEYMHRIYNNIGGKETSIKYVTNLVEWGMISPENLEKFFKDIVSASYKCRMEGGCYTVPTLSVAIEKELERREQLKDDFDDLAFTIFREYGFDAKIFHKLRTDEMRDMRRQIEDGVLFDEREMTLAIYKAVRDAISDKKDRNYRRIRKDIKNLEKEIENNPPKNPEPPKQPEPPMQPEPPKQPEPPTKQPEKKPLVYSGKVHGYVQSKNSEREFHEPDSLTVTNTDDGEKLKITLRYPSVPGDYSLELGDSNTFSGYSIYSINEIFDSSGRKIRPGFFSRLYLTTEKDFYELYLQSTPTENHREGNIVGYGGQRLTKTKVPSQKSGVSRYSVAIGPSMMLKEDFQPHRNMTLYINWKTGKVYGVGPDLIHSLFIGDLDRDNAEVDGNLVQINYVASGTKLDNRKSAEKVLLQLYGDDFANGIGGFFDAIHTRSFTAPGREPELERAWMMGRLGEKKIAEKTELPKDNDDWLGFATGVVQHMAQPPVLAYNTNPNDVRLTLHPNDGTMEAVVNVKNLDGKDSYRFSSDSQDSVYINQNAFAALKEVDGVPSYLTTSMGTEDTATYDYLSWGYWAAGLIDTPEREVRGADSRWIAGALTKPDIIKEKVGTASYTGWVTGYMTGGDGFADNLTVDGNIKLTADFRKKENMTVIGALNFSHGMDAPGILPKSVSADIKGKISGNRFSGDLKAENVIKSGKLNGAFYGPKAQEVGGNWMMKADKWQATGIFAGKEQPQKK